MTDYISMDTAICIADYAADEHPYDKDPAKPETFSEYNQGWHDACDYIRERLENAQNSDVAPVRHGKWVDKMVRDWHCSECGKAVPKQVRFDGYCYEDKLNYCPNCGAWMGGADNGE